MTAPHDRDDCGQPSRLSLIGSSFRSSFGLSFGLSFRLEGGHELVWSIGRMVCGSHESTLSHPFATMHAWPTAPTPHRPHSSWRCSRRATPHCTTFHFSSVSIRVPARAGSPISLPSRRSLPSEQPPARQMPRRHPPAVPPKCQISQQPVLGPLLRPSASGRGPVARLPAKWWSPRCRSTAGWLHGSVRASHE